MKTLHAIKPTTDSKLKWNEESERYELTLEYCKSEFEDNFRDDEELKRRIKRNTKVVYGFIRYRVASYNREIVKRVLNNTKEGRDFIFEMLTTQMDADVETAYNDLAKQPAINMANGQIIDRNQIWANQVSVETEQIFDDSDAYFGFRIGYQAPLPRNLLVFIK